MYGGGEDGQRAAEFLERMKEWPEIEEGWKEAFHGEWSDEADFLAWPKDDVVDVIRDMKRERAAVKLAFLAMRLQGKFKPPKKGKTDKKAVPLAKEVSEAAKELEGAWDGGED